ncbi:hypothetical protein ABK905_17715 [Acerihabitans sp. KWT182]|uniref:Uncharacterized protein n=1 Tax=Acerihabitans sp. KWT182 TaxID=3157919 RepID=A0AAU7Q8I0_9GAMM
MMSNTLYHASLPAAKRHDVVPPDFKLLHGMIDKLEAVHNSLMDSSLPLSLFKTRESDMLDMLGPLHDIMAHICELIIEDSRLLRDGAALAGKRAMLSPNSMPNTPSTSITMGTAATTVATVVKSTAPSVLDVVLMNESRLSAIGEIPPAVGPLDNFSANNRTIALDPVFPVDSDSKNIERLYELIQRVQLALIPLKGRLETRAEAQKIQGLTHGLLKEAGRIEKQMKEGLFASGGKP